MIIDQIDDMEFICFKNDIENKNIIKRIIKRIMKTHENS
jgi:hypothetical protein